MNVVMLAAAGSRAVSVLDAVRIDPWGAVVAGVGLAVVTVAAGLALRQLLVRSSALRFTVVAVTVASLVLAMAAAVVAADLMVLASDDFGSFRDVLVVAAVFAIGLAVLVTRPVARDVRRLGSTAMRVQDGDLSVRTGIDRRDEIGRAADAIDQMVARLAELDRARTTIEDERRAVLTSISHDLRSPLAALSAAVEALVDGVAPDAARYHQAMQADVRALGHLIDDLFLLVRIEAGRLDLAFEAVDVAEVADEARESLVPVADARGVHLAFDATGRAPVIGDAAALGRVVRNLVENAIGFAPAGTEVRVSVAVADEVRLAVTDAGPGFDDHFRVRALEPFTRADPSRTRGAGGGAGLGLAIVHGLVDAHGGSVELEAGAGGRVAVRLPLPAPGPAPSTSAPVG